MYNLIKSKIKNQLISNNQIIQSPSKNIIRLDILIISPFIKNLKDNYFFFKNIFLNKNHCVMFVYAFKEDPEFY